MLAASSDSGMDSCRIWFCHRTRSQTARPSYRRADDGPDCKMPESPRINNSPGTGRASARARESSIARFRFPALPFFTPQQAADCAAFAEQIIPTDDTPGAKEANVVCFVDFVCIISSIPSSHIFSHPEFPQTRVESPYGKGPVRQVNPRESRGLEWICQAVSLMERPCDVSVSYECGIGGHWFCAAHTEDEVWHHCVLEPGHNFSAFPSAYSLMMVGHAFPLKGRKTRPRSVLDTAFLEVSVLNKLEAGRLS